MFADTAPVPGSKYWCIKGSLCGLCDILYTRDMFLTRLGVEELGLGPPNWFGGVGLESPPEKEKHIYFVNF